MRAHGGVILVKRLWHLACQVVPLQLLVCRYSFHGHLWLVCFLRSTFSLHETQRQEKLLAACKRK